MKEIETLTKIGNLLGLEGRFGVRWGLVQLHARLALVEAEAVGTTHMFSAMPMSVDLSPPKKAS